MTDRTGVELDAPAIKVLAHPLRSRLLSRLRTTGPATATELAEALTTNTGATSYHLRKLESVGLVTDTGEGEGKRRLWRASTDFHAWRRSTVTDEDAATALGWLERHYIHQLTARAEAWQDALEGWPGEWVDELGLHDDMITVTQAQFAAFRADYETLLDRYRAVGAGDDTARTITVHQYASPLDTTPPTR